MVKGLRRLLILITAMLLMSGLTLTAQAASRPGTVAVVKAYAGESQVVLKWTKAEGAKGYYIFRATGNGAPVGYRKLKSTALTVTLKAQENGVKYTYYVAGYNDAGSGPRSKGASATPQVSGLTAPYMYAAAAGSKYVTLSWRTSSKVDAYQIFSVNNGKYTYHGSTKDGYFTVNKLTPYTRYQFVIRVCRVVDGKKWYGQVGKVVTTATTRDGASIRTSAIEEDGTRFGVHPYRWKARMRRTLKVTSEKTGKSITIKSGANIKVTKRDNKKASFIYNGQTYTTARSNVSIYGLEWKSGAYNDYIARKFVNQAGYYSSTGWLIWISTYSQRVYIFKGSAGNWKLQRSFSCNTGNIGTETKIGRTRISGKQYTWYFEGVPCANYASRISSGAFHTWPYGGFGHPASHGCVRCPNNQAIFIYNNVPTNTAVYVF